MRSDSPESLCIKVTLIERQVGNKEKSKRVIGPGDAIRLSPSLEREGPKFRMHKRADRKSRAVLFCGAMYSRYTFLIAFVMVSSAFYSFTRAKGRSRERNRLGFNRKRAKEEDERDERDRSSFGNRDAKARKETISNSMRVVAWENTRHRDENHDSVSSNEKGVAAKKERERSDIASSRSTISESICNEAGSASEKMKTGRLARGGPNERRQKLLQWF